MLEASFAGSLTGIVRSDQMTVTLRKVMQGDLPIFFEHQLDAEATRMAAFPSRDRDAFMAHWARIMSNETDPEHHPRGRHRGRQRRLLGSGGGAEHRLLARQDTLGEGDCKCGPGAIFDEDRGATSLRACGKAQCRFDPCLTKMRIPTCKRGYVRWRRWRRTCYGAALRSLRPGLQ
jgi:hypothetical protein